MVQHPKDKDNIKLYYLYWVLVKDIPKTVSFHILYLIYSVREKKITMRISGLMLYKFPWIRAQDGWYGKPAVSTKLSSLISLWQMFSTAQLTYTGCLLQFQSISLIRNLIEKITHCYAAIIRTLPDWDKKCTKLLSHIWSTSGNI